MAYCCGGMLSAICIGCELSALHQGPSGHGATHQLEEAGAGDERSGIEKREVAGFGVAGEERALTG